MPPRLHDWTILQRGSLPLRPDNRITDAPHACTSALVWPEGQKPSAPDAILTDPCFTRAGQALAETVLANLGASLDRCDCYFETHQHHDHLLHIEGKLPTRRRRFAPNHDLSTVACPGHSPDMTALVVPTRQGRLWIVGDAILDEDWLRAWGYYWPNLYEPAEIIETWRSVALILSRADVIIPGHGGPITVTRELLEGLLADFPMAAEYAYQCPDVAETLRKRLEAMP